MKKLTLNRPADHLSEDYVPVMVGKNGAMRCCCGYELIKQDDQTYRCTGGSHVYSLQEGDMIRDKNGNLLIRNFAQGNAQMNMKR